MIAKRIELENSYRSLKPEQSKLFAEIHARFQSLRGEAIQKLNDDIARLSKDYYDSLALSKSARRELWLDKLRIENSSPLDLEALAKNRNEYAKEKHIAQDITAIYEANIRKIKHEYKMYKIQLAANECNQIATVKNDICRRRSEILSQIAQIKLKGGQNG